MMITIINQIHNAPACLRVGTKSPLIWAAIRSSNPPNSLSPMNMTGNFSLLITVSPNSLMMIWGKWLMNLVECTWINITKFLGENEDIITNATLYFVTWWKVANLFILNQIHLNFGLVLTVKQIGTGLVWLNNLGPNKLNHNSNVGLVWIMV